MELVIARELELYGSHGLAARDYPKLLSLVTSGKLDPRKLVRRIIPLAAAPKALADLSDFQQAGITIIQPGLSS
jgi:alcohol dehydrogenase